MTQRAVVSTDKRVGDEMTSEAKCGINPQAKCLTVCKHHHVFIAPEKFVSLQGRERLLEHAVCKVSKCLQMLHEARINTCKEHG